MSEPQLQPDEEEYVSDHKAALLNKSTLLANSVLYLLSVLLVIGLIWAYFAEIDQTTSANGKVIPSTEDKIIQSLDGGVVEKIFVREGDLVQANQPLLKIDETRDASEYQNNYAKFLALSAMVSRLTAEAHNDSQITFSKEVKEHPELMQLETKLLLARREAMTKEIAVLQDSLKVANEEFKMYSKLINKGFVSRLEYNRAQRNINDIQIRIFEKQDQFRENALTELNQRSGDLASLKEGLISLHDKMTHTLLRSPVTGFVKKSYINTIGGVINPGMTIMEIVPQDDKLIIEAQVQPKDIAFIHPGQKANVMISAYDYSIYGSLKGKVEYISPDAIEDKTSTDKNLMNFYLVRIRTDKNFLGTEKHPLPILPGMTASTRIATGKKTVMDYLLKPLLKAKEEALRER